MTLGQEAIRGRMADLSRELMHLSNQAQGCAKEWDQILAADAALQPLTLYQALDEFSVMDAEDVASFSNLTGWFAVVDEDGINAYFSTETAAFRHRLDLINRRLNP